LVNREYSAHSHDSEITRLLEILPETVRTELYALPNLETIIEIVMDLGRIPEARFESSIVPLGDTPISHNDLLKIEAAVSGFGSDNRAGIEATLHRISAIRNRAGKIVGYTCRVGRAVFGTIDVLLDIVRSGKSICLLGPPGVGKTTILRECARILAEDRKRVVIVDTSNEIGGDGDIPHPGIGGARRMQVADATVQHRVMIEAVENHMPEVVVIDEIGTEAEAAAARTIAERGVQLIGTAHGKTLENLLMNPTLSDLVGGIETVTLSDEEARRRETRKTVLERKFPPSFDILIEIEHQGRFTIHKDVTEAVDALLRGQEPRPELRARNHADVSPEVALAPTKPVLRALPENDFAAALKTFESRPTPKPEVKGTKIYPYGISTEKLSTAIDALGLDMSITFSLDDADIVFSLSAIKQKISNKLRSLAAENVPVIAIGSKPSDLHAALRALSPHKSDRRRLNLSRYSA
jgi:stage III sporulation protein SpoIIIAA